MDEEHRAVSVRDFQQRPHCFGVLARQEVVSRYLGADHTRQPERQFELGGGVTERVHAGQSPRPRGDGRGRRAGPSAPCGGAQHHRRRHHRRRRQHRRGTPLTGDGALSRSLPLRETQGKIFFGACPALQSHFGSIPCKGFSGRTNGPAGKRQGSRKPSDRRLASNVNCYHSNYSLIFSHGCIKWCRTSLWQAGRSVSAG